MVKAWEQKNLYSPLRKRKLSVVALEERGGGLHREYSSLFVARQFDGVERAFDVLDPQDRTIPGMRLIDKNDLKRYTHGIREPIDVYDANGVSLILSKKSGKVLRLQVVSSWKIGLTKGEMKEIPISITDLRLLFGDGDYTNALMW